MSASFGIFGERHRGPPSELKLMHANIPVLDMLIGESMRRTGASLEVREEKLRTGGAPLKCFRL